jgi:hypothetical protein
MTFLSFCLSFYFSLFFPFSFLKIVQFEYACYQKWNSDLFILSVYWFHSCSFCFWCWIHSCPFCSNINFSVVFFCSRISTSVHFVCLFVCLFSVISCIYIFPIWSKCNNDTGKSVMINRWW